MDPRYRFTLVVSFLLTGWWLYVVLSTYLIGEGLNIARYIDGVMWVGAAAIAGFMLVWVATKIVAWQKNRSTGFEAAAEDEFGTMFLMTPPGGGDGQPYSLSLSKFLPQMVAPPTWPGLTALEAELMGFLNAYRHWPLDLSTPETSLYEQSMARWQVMRHLPGSGPWHRAAALAKDLALVHAYKESRTTYPWWEFWKRDRVKFTQRSKPHGGITAFVVSTLPAFRDLGNSSEGAAAQRALLTALRYHDAPGSLPVNAGPLARELVDYLWRADAQLRQLDVGKLDEMTPALLEELKASVATNWLATLSEIPVSGELVEGTPALRSHDGTVWVRLSEVLSRLGPTLKPEVRQLLKLWDVDGGMHHPAWAHLGPILQDAGLIAGSHDGVSAVNGCFSLRGGEVTMGPVVKLMLDPARHLPVIQLWQNVPPYRGVLDVVLDLDQLNASATNKASSLDVKMAEIF